MCKTDMVQEQVKVWCCPQVLGGRANMYWHLQLTCKKKDTHWKITVQSTRGFSEPFPPTHHTSSNHDPPKLPVKTVLGI